jgi:uncharacterized protein (TIGR03435 family)
MHTDNKIGTLRGLAGQYAWMLLAASAFGQGFEVVSIKQASFPDDSYFAGFTAATNCGKAVLGISGDRVTIQKINLCGLIRLAYDVEDFRVLGVPKTLLQADRSNYFDVEARAAAGPLTQDQAREMLRAMLADRFQLKLHHETKEVPVYGLVVGKKGAAKLSTQPICETPPKFDPDHPTMGMTYCKPTRSMAQLAVDLTGYLDRPVVDQTGLPGLYAFSLRVGLENARLKPNPDMFTAVQEQLGLKLEPQKAEFDSLVVDRAERPTEN